MLEVQKYLLENSLKKLTEDYAIKVKRHSRYPNLVNFCYSQIESPTYHPIVKECRGLILDESNSWQVVAYPFSRFYNYSQPGTEYIDWQTTVTYEKLDGSLIVLANYRGWLISTKGSPDASGQVGDFNFTFNELAWDTFRKEGYLLSELNKNYTYCFELTSPYNKVVVPYSDCQLTLIGVRDNITFKELPIDKFPEFRLCKQYPLNSWESILSSLEKLSGQHNEGYVVCDANFNRVKVKHPGWAALAHMKDGLTKRRILELIRTGEDEEFLLYFEEFRNLFDELKTKYNNLVNNIEVSWNKYKDITDKKEFALQVKDYSYSGTLFQLKNKQVNSIQESLQKILIQNLEKLIES
jgi:RNA ligase